MSSTMAFEMETFDLETLISDRARSIDVSGIRRVFELGAKLEKPINLSIGQPDFPVPDALKQAAVAAILGDRNGYTLTQGVPELVASIRTHLRKDVGWNLDGGDLNAIVTTGTSGGLQLAMLALLNPGEEVIAGDPYFVAYEPMVKIAGGKFVPVDCYPDFRLTAERVESVITSRTKIVIVGSPGNPSGVVLNSQELRELVELCESRGILIVSDEIYDEFTYADARENGRCPSPARISERTLLIRGFGKTYGCTGWRLGYVAGPKTLIQQIAKLQQYTFVCAPSALQVAVAHAFDVDMSPVIARYAERRNLVERELGSVTNVTHPGGAFYAFVEVPKRLKMTATEFCEKAISKNVLVIPGRVFSRRDTHFRLSYAVSDESLAMGLSILKSLMQ
ncbi:MAG TPA: aminotransferase class I/II-fold pyridoxal phosphate-dependent enzyme [Phycisphaerales bacterium]|nr:aminotransferase class I/II-fold pyridoxal phosphate-dependent enzyme [Phycisphaerales bacterium]